ncbi:MAG: hypothetical protein ACRDHG_12010, partial [Anaerolineales bacterium]
MANRYLDDLNRSLGSQSVAEPRLPSGNRYLRDLEDISGREEEEEPGLLSRALHRFGAVAGTLGRGVDVPVSVARGLLEEGDPLARFKLRPEAAPPLPPEARPAKPERLRGVGSDVAAALGLVEPTIEQQTLGQQIGEAAFGEPTKEEGYGRAIGREAVTFLGDIARDPVAQAAVTARYIGPAARALLGERGAAAAGTAAHRAFQAMMAEGAIRGGQQAYRTTKEEGFT